MGSDLESNLGPEGHFHDGGWLGGRGVGGGGAESGGENLYITSGSGFWRVDGDSGNLGNWRESGGVEGRDRHGGHGGDAGCSWQLGRRWGEEIGESRAELCAIQERAAPAGGAPSLPTFFSGGAESGDVDVTILINGHFGQLFGERDHSGKRFRERGTGQKGVPSSLEESQLVDLGETGEKESQPRAGRRRDELDGDERVRRESNDQGRFNSGQVDPEAVDLHEIVGGRHHGRGRERKKSRKNRGVASWLQSRRPASRVDNRQD